jgi:hypothetical protein
MACNWKMACGYLTADGQDVGDVLISEADAIRANGAPRRDPQSRGSSGENLPKKRQSLRLRCNMNFIHECTKKKDVSGYGRALAYSCLKMWRGA